MENAYQPPFLEMMCTRRHLGEHGSKPTSSVQHSKNASAACQRPQQVQTQRTQEEHGDVERCVVIGQDPTDSTTEQAQQHDKHVVDDCSVRATTQYSQEPSKLACSEEATKTGAPLPAERQSDATRTEEDARSDWCAPAQDSRARDTVGDAEKATVKRAGSRPLLLPQQDAPTDRATEEGNTNTSAERETRVSSDSLCSPTAFSVAATAASVTCSSPPSCTSRGERDVANKLDADGEAAERVEDIQRQDLPLPAVQRGVKSLSEARLNAVYHLHQTQPYNGREPQLPQSEDSKLGHQQIQRSQYEVGNTHDERNDQEHDRTHGCSNQLLRSPPLQADIYENNGDESEREKSRFARSASVTSPSTETRAVDQTSRSHASLNATRGHVITTDDSWAEFSSRKTVHSYVSVTHAEPIPLLPPPSAYGEEEMKMLAAASTEDVTARPPRPTIGRKSTSATTRSSRSGTLPSGDVTDVAGHRPGPDGTEANFRCSYADPPSCRFCSNVNELAFPPPPGHLVVQFIAYVFEPQLQRLQRRLQENTRRGLSLELQFDRNDGVSVKNFPVNSTSRATTLAQVPTPSSRTVESALADVGAATCAGFTNAPASNESPSPESSISWCQLDLKHLKKSSCASLSPTCTGCFCSSEVDGDAGEDTCGKPSSGRVPAECEPVDSPSGITSCMPSSANCIPNRKSTQLSSFSAAHSSIVKLGSTGGAATAPDANTAAALQRRPHSALLALQLKHHLLSLLCYMERLPKGSHLGAVHSSATPLLPQDQAISPSKLCTRHVLEHWQRRLSKDIEAATKSSSCPCESDLFAFHIEELLRAEIVLPTSSQLKPGRVCSTPAVPQGETPLKPSGVAEHRRPTKTPSVAVNCSQDQTVRLDGACGVSRYAFRETRTPRQGSGTTPEHTVACTLPSEALRNLPTATGTAKPENEIDTEAMAEERNPRRPQDVEGGAERMVRLDRNTSRTGTATPDAQPLLQQQAEEMAGASPLSYKSSVAMTVSGDLALETAEDAVLLGAPPSMVNYLIVFSPLLVLQALQQMGGAAPAAGEKTGSCDIGARGYDQSAKRDNTPVHEKPPEDPRGNSGVRSAADIEESAVGQRSWTPVTAVEDAFVSQSSSVVTKLTTPTAAGVEDARGAEQSCASTGAGRQPTWRNRSETEECERARIDPMTGSVPHPVFDVTADNETGFEETLSAGARAAGGACLAEARRTPVPAEPEAATAARRTYNHAGITSSALQTELRSALCWADRGLVALFRALSPPHAERPASTACHEHPLVCRSHSARTTVRQTRAPNTCSHISEEVTPESLTAALLLLAKAIKQSRCEQTGEARLRASRHSNCDHCTRKIVCTTSEEPVNSWHANCLPVQQSLVTCKRLPSTAVSQTAPDSPTSLATISAELDSCQQQLRHCPQYSGEPRADVDAEAQSQQKGSSRKEDEGRAKIEKTKDVLECASSRASVATPTRGDDAEAKVETLEISRLQSSIYSSMLPAYDWGDSVADREVVCSHSLRDRERRAAVFFAPLHYPQQDCARYADRGVEEVQLETPANAVFTSHGVVFKRTGGTPPVAESDCKPSAETIETTAQGDLVEHLALEILAQVDSSAFLQEEDAHDTTRQQWSGEHRQGKNDAHATIGDSLKYGNTEAGKHTDPAATDDWMGQVAQLFMEKGAHDKSNISENSCFGACGRDEALLNEDTEARSIKSCSSQEVHRYVQSVPRQNRTKTDAVALGYRSSVTEIPVMENELYSKGLSGSEYTKKRRYCLAGDPPSHEVRGGEISSYVKSSGFIQSSQIFEATGTQAEDGSAAAGDRKPSGSFKEPPSHHGQARSLVTRPCLASKSATCTENSDATERRSSSPEVATSTAPAVAAGDMYLYSVSPEDGNTPYRATEKFSCPSRTEDILNSVRADEMDFSEAGKGKERHRQRHQRAMYEGACDTDTAHASVSKVVKPQDAPKHRVAEDPASQLNLQQWVTEEQSRDQHVEVRSSLPSAARSGADSSSSTSRVHSVQRVIPPPNARPNTTNEVNNRAWGNSENRGGNTDSGARLARTGGSFAEGERSLKDEIPGQTRLTWHRRRSKLQQRPQQAAKPAEESAGEKRGQDRSCRLKRCLPCREDETSGQDEQPVRDRRNGRRRSGTSVAVLSLDEEALRTRETRPSRALSSSYNESEDHKGSWKEGNHEVLPRYLGNADGTDTGVDTRRPMRGVYFDRTQRSWIGSFYEDRRQIKKRFKVDTYGFLKAKALAVDVRLGYERRMLSGVVGATGFAASSGADTASKLKRIAAARKDAGFSLDAEGGNRNAETLLAGGGANSWMTSATNAPQDVQQEFSSPEAQQHKVHLKTFTKKRSQSTPGAVEENDLQVDRDTWVMQKTQPSCLSRPPGHLASDLACVSAKNTGEFPAACVEPDWATEEASENSPLCSYASGALTSHVVWSSGGTTDTALNSASARSGGTADGQRLLLKEPQDNKRKNVECAFSHDVPAATRKRTVVDAHAPHVDVEPPKMCATEGLAIQSRNGTPVKPSVCSVGRSKTGEECLLHVGTRAAATSGSESQLDTQSEQEDQETRSDQDAEFSEGCRIKASDRFCMSEEEKAHRGTEKPSWQAGRTRQKRAAPEGRRHAGTRELDEQNVLVQKMCSRNYVCAKMLPVPTQLAAPQRVEDLAERDVLQPAASRRLAKGTSRNGKCRHNCSSLTEKDTFTSSARSCAHGSVGMRTAPGATRGKRTYMLTRVQGRSGHSCPKVGYLSEDANLRRTAEKEESGRRLTEPEERTSTGSARVTVPSRRVSESLRLEGQPHEASDKSESAPSSRRGNALAVVTSEAVSRVERGQTDGSLVRPAEHEADPSRDTMSTGGSACDRLYTDEYPPIRPNTGRPEIPAAAAYMCSKRRRRLNDALTEGARGAAAHFVHNLPPGVFYTSKKHAYCANWYEGKRQLKRYFPICKLGEPEARRLAIAARRDAERREREARCRTGGSTSTQTACTDVKSFLDTAYAEHDLPSDPAAVSPAPPTAFHRRASPEDMCAVQTEQLEALNR